MIETNAPILFKNYTAEGLHERLASVGVSLRLARRLQAVIVRGAAREIPSQMPEVARKTLEVVRNTAIVPHLEVVDTVVSAHDGFMKYLFRGEGVERFEAVRIPLLHREHDKKYVACVSSQVGCALACAFCATGKLGFRRNLATWEIVDQVVRMQADAPHPVRGVVFMGMGEPMLNYEAVMRAAQILSEPCGMAIDAKAITISTVGVVPMIQRFTAERRPYRLVVSLTSADHERRRALLPIEDKYPLPELMEAVRSYHQATGKRVILAWTLIAGMNTRLEDARDLARLTTGVPIQLDLIDVNDASGRFQPPGDAERNAFLDALRSELGMPVVRRYSGGQDIRAGCGMLANSRRFALEDGDLATGGNDANQAEPRLLQ